MKYLALVTVLLTGYFIGVPVRAAETPDFRLIVETRLKDRYKTSLERICPVYTDWVAARVFAEYGALFISENGTVYPRKCIVESEAEMELIQREMNPQSENIGGVTITLQKPAMEALIKARKAAAERGLSITPRGGSTASMRSYAKTVELWNSRFDPALNYWVGKGRIKPADAQAVRQANIRAQVARVLQWEQEKIWFSKDLSKSILYSVAAPGASQHNFMLALDVEQYANPRVREILADHGWFQTVKSDLPHFTYLGLKKKELPSRGLRSTTVDGQEFWIPYLGGEE